MKVKNKCIKADKGKIFRRKSDGLIYGRQIDLGYTYFIGGVKLETPILELPEHFEEVDEEVTLDMILIDEETPLEEELIEDNEPRKVTLADYHALEEKVNRLMEKLGGDI